MRLNHIKVLLLSLGLLFYLGADAQVKLSLEECYDLVLQNNKQVKIAQSGINESDAAARANTVNKLPKFEITGTGMMYFNMADINMPGQFLQTANSVEDAKAGNFTGESNVWMPGFNLELGDVKYYTAGLTASQAIYAGNKINNANKISKQIIEINKSNYSKVSIELLTKTDQVYWDLVSLKDKNILADNLIKMLESLVEDLQNSFDIGLINKSDLLKAKVRLNEAKLNKQRINNAYELCMMQLNQMMGSPLSTLIEPISNLKSPKDFSFVNAKVLTKKINRPELSMMEGNLNISELQKQITKGDYLPELGMQASYSMTDIGGLTESNWNFNIAASLKIPLFNWNEKKHKLKSHKYKIKQQKLQLDNTNELIRLEIEQAIKNVIEVQKEINMAQISVEQARENLKEMRNSYDVGLSTLTDLLTAQVDLNNAENTYVDAMKNFEISKSNYLKATGTREYN